MQMSATLGALCTIRHEDLQLPMPEVSLGLTIQLIGRTLTASCKTSAMYPLNAFTNWNLVTLRILFEGAAFSALLVFHLRNLFDPVIRASNHELQTMNFTDTPTGLVPEIASELHRLSDERLWRRKASASTEGLPLKASNWRSRDLRMPLIFGRIRTVSSALFSRIVLLNFKM